MTEMDYSGFFRAKVIDSRDPKKCGRVKVYIPDLMQKLPETEGLWAKSSNNPIGGRSSDGSHYAGCSYVPPVGSFVWIFFEKNNTNVPYYFGALDLENTEVPVENQVGDNYEKKWTLLKSTEGRSIVVSDDPSDARVEITSAKKQMSNPPSGTGNPDSAYNIDSNMTSIMIDDKSGSEKILIRTRKGDFIKISVEEQELSIHMKNDIMIKSGGSIYISAEKSLNLVSHDDLNLQADNNINEIAGGKSESKSTGTIRINGSKIFLNSGSTPSNEDTSLITFKGTRNA